MFDGGYDSNNPFPHDGEGGHSCKGYGCDCDERNYGNRYGGVGGSGGSGGTGIGVWGVMILAFIIGYGFNELLGTIIILGVIFYVLVR